MSPIWLLNMNHDINESVRVTFSFSLSHSLPNDIFGYYACKNHTHTDKHITCHYLSVSYMHRTTICGSHPQTKTKRHSIFFPHLFLLNSFTFECISTIIAIKHFHKMILLLLLMRLCVCLLILLFWFVWLLVWLIAFYL